ncbi:MAG: hypothetical protein RL148_852 [Planctomycetota bacterium]|jgi:leucine dehydrogenase
MSLLPDLPGDGDFEQVQVLVDRASGMQAVLAVHDTRMGPAFGGIRRRAYGSVADATRDVLALASAMTWKCAMAGLPAGGGKLVLVDHPGLDREAAYRRIGEFVESLGGRFSTGPDVGTTDADLRAVCSRTRHCADPDSGGPGDLGRATALGVFHALQATARHAGLVLEGATVLVQGLGTVGGPLARMCREVGARLLLADVDGQRAKCLAAELGAGLVDPDRVLETRCDVLAPCALGGLLDEAAARSLSARAVCGAANNLLASDRVGRILHERGIPVAPDFVANAGALIVGCLHQLHGTRVGDDRIVAIGQVVAGLLEESARTGVPPGEVALARARSRVAAVPHRLYLGGS